jgi:hypothetical protein
MKKEATLKHKGLREGPLVKKRDNPKTQGAKRKTSDEKRGNPKM